MTGHKVIGAITAAVLVTCSMNAQTAVSPDGIYDHIRPDVVYGHRDGMALIYDAFIAAEPNGAGVVWIVSGAWISPWVDPAKHLSSLAALLNEGFSVFAVYHASAPRFTVPEAVSDARAALRHIQARATNYGIDPGRLGVWGGSTGGHMSLMLGLDPEGVPASPASDGVSWGPHYRATDSDARVAAVVADYPIVDLRGQVGPHSWSPALDFSAEEAASVSPIAFVSTDDPPTLLIHGAADEVVSLADSQTLASAFEKTGVPHDVLVIEGGDHGFSIPAHREEADRAIVAWFKRHLSTAATP